MIILATMMQTQADRIIEKFGTQIRLAEALGCSQSVIAGWKKRGFVPANRQTEVLKAAADLGIGLQPNDFFPVSDAAA